MSTLRLATAWTWLLLAGLTVAQAEQARDETERPLHPSRLAAESDLVVLAQLDRMNYERRRGFPVGGQAWAEVLIRYKADRPVERLRIVEEGLGPDRCYFPDVPLWQELPRFLLFLHRTEGSDFTGHRGGCMLEVLVTSDNRYAVRWPQDGLRLEPEELDLVEPLDFIGPGARIDVSEETSISRDRLLRDDHMEDLGDSTFRYTRGIPLAVFREKIIGQANLTEGGLPQRR